MDWHAPRHAAWRGCLPAWLKHACASPIHRHAIATPYTSWSGMAALCVVQHHAMTEHGFGQCLNDLQVQHEPPEGDCRTRVASGGDHSTHTDKPGTTSTCSPSRLITAF
eukprot:351479-Chlamydomonas_euryale.AAC.16